MGVVSDPEPYPQLKELQVYLFLTWGSTQKHGGKRAVLGLKSVEKIHSHLSLPLPTPQTGFVLSDRLQYEKLQRLFQREF